MIQKKIHDKNVYLFWRKGEYIVRGAQKINQKKGVCNARKSKEMDFCNFNCRNDHTYAS